MRHKQHSHECTDCFCTFVRLYCGCTPSQVVEKKAQHASELREPAKQEEWRSPEGALGKFLLQKQDNGGRAPTRKRWEQLEVTNSTNLRMESVAGRFWPVELYNQYHEEPLHPDNFQSLPTGEKGC